MNINSFIKKECLELVKTGRGFILIVLFLFTAILSPITAKYMNDIIRNLAQIDIPIYRTSILDSYIQLFKNMDSICILVMIIISTGAIVIEKKKGTIILMLSKGLTRINFIIAKFLVYIGFFTIVYILSIITFIFYSYVLFGTYVVDNMFLALIVYWIYGCSVIAFSLLISTVVHSLISGICINLFLNIAVFNILSITKKVYFLSPAYLKDICKSLIMGKIPSNLLISIGVGILYIIFSFFYSSFIFKNQEL